MFALGLLTLDAAGVVAAPGNSFTPFLFSRAELTFEVVSPVLLFESQLVPVERHDDSTFWRRLS